MKKKKAAQKSRNSLKTYQKTIRRLEAENIELQAQVELLREETLKNIENHIDQIVRLSQSVGLSEQEVLDMVKFAMED